MLCVSNEIKKEINRINIIPYTEVRSVREIKISRLSILD